MIYLILAVFWLLTGVLLLAWDWWYPGLSPYRLPGTELSLGWLALLLSLYNIVRFWARRSAARQGVPMRRWRERRGQVSRSSPVESDPNFNFTEIPPRKEPRSDEPPG
jgi:hypothetical protein